MEFSTGISNDIVYGTKIKLQNILFKTTIAIFILSEYCPLLNFIDPLKVKHIFLIITTLIAILAVIKNGKKLKFAKEFKSILFSTIILYTISITLQAFNGEFKFYSIEEVYYLLMPLIFVFLLYGYEKPEKIDNYVNIIYICCIISFITRYYDIFSIENLMKISFNDSASPFEGDLAQFFFMLVVYYIYKGYKVRTIVCIALNILSMKRLNLVYMFVFLIIFKFIPKNKKVDNKILFITKLFFILAPFLIYIMCTDDFASWFLLKFDISFDKFTMSRFSIINTVIDENLINYGLGTVTDFLEIRNVPGQTNMHNDILKIYMECTLLGTIVFTNQYFKICSNNYMSYVIMLFAFLELLVAHFLGPGSILFWICAYILIFYFNSEQYSNSYNDI